MTQKLVKFDPEKYSEDQLAVQSNDVLFGQHSFNLLQGRIWLLAIAQIRREDKELKPYRVHISDLREFGVSDDIYNHLGRVTDGMMRKIFRRRIYDNTGEIGFQKWPLISYAEHIKGSGYIEIKIAPEMKELLLDLQEKGNFTPVPLVNAGACRSVYGSRIYAMLYSWRRHNRMEISVEQLRKILKCEDEYPNFYNFRKYVLKKAQKDLQKHTNMRFTWKEECNSRGRGSGRRVTDLIFDFSFIADQMDMTLDEPKKKVNFDIYNLRERLKNHAELPANKINSVMDFLKNNPDSREIFKQKYYQIEVLLMQGTDDQNRQINSKSGFAWNRIKPLIEK